VCGDQPFIYNGYRFSESCDTTIFLKSVDGCDSVVNLHLVVIKPFGVSVDDGYHFACADEEKLLFDYNDIDGLRLPSEYSVLYDSFEESNGFVDQENIALDTDNQRIEILIPEGCRPNSYSATLLFKDTTGVCGDISVPISFDIYYSSSILQPKFDNLITVLDASANGGYDFVEGEYEWYKNDELVDTVKHAFYYLTDDMKFNGEDCFYMIPKRKDDGVAIRTCEICPSSGTPIYDIYETEVLIDATIVSGGDAVLLKGIDRGIATIYSFTGTLFGSYSIDSDHQHVVVPYERGFYIVKIQTEEINYVYKIWVK
jgi:hypothetical protein